MFQLKHVFIIAAKDNFFYLNADALINKAGVDPNKMVVLVFGASKTDLDMMRKVDGVTYDIVNEQNIAALMEAKTITFMSVNAQNSQYINAALELDRNMVDKVHIFVTDDEIDRWNHSYKKYGELKVNTSPKITQQEIDVINKLRLFIGHSGTFFTKVKEILKRDDVKFIDAGVIFDTLACHIVNPLNDAILKNEQLAGKEQKILIGTKQKSVDLNEIKSILLSLCRYKAGESYKILIMWHKKHRKQRILLDLFIIWLRHVRRQTIDISYVTALSPVAYTALISSCSHIVLQRRGGASTVRSYLKLGKGILCVSAGSENEFGFKKALGLDVISFHSSDELVSGILNSKIDARLNAEKTIAEEFRSSKVLSALYG
ncbi:hypothetical protein [Vibrio cortegadensis]|uniref:Uncharacterized protein n=1 Tax=Vibrio cortegadensis TaxID=1328770 RepID=A0ABV4M717_9VIBR